MQQTRTKQTSLNNQNISQLYLKQFFTNYYLKQSKKQQNIIYSTSIQVLDQLITQYEEKLTIQQQNSQIYTSRKSISSSANQINYQENFEQFYNRLKTLFQSVQKKLINSNSQFRISKQSRNLNYSYLQMQEQENNENNESLFPQNSQYVVKNSKNCMKILNKQRPNIQISDRQKPINCDEDLYELILQLKEQTRQKSQKISNFEKLLKQKTSQQKLKQKQLKSQKLSSKALKQQLLALKTKYQIVNNQKISAQAQNNQSLDRIQNLCLINQQLKNDLSQKNKQIQSLLYFQKQKQKLEGLNKELNNKVDEKQSQLNNCRKQKDELFKKIEQVKQENKRYIAQSQKLKQIIIKKLNSLKLSQKISCNKQNMSHNIQMDNKLCRQSYDQKSHQKQGSKNYIKEMIDSKLANKEIMNYFLQKQFIRFIKNTSSLQ